MKTHCIHGHPLERTATRKGTARAWCPTCVRRANLTGKRIDAETRIPGVCECGCGREFDGPRSGRRWFSKRCRANYAYRQAVIAKTGRPPRRRFSAADHPMSAFIYEALEDTEKGRCPWCDGPLRPKQVVSCGSEDCNREYQRVHRRCRTALEVDAKWPMRSQVCRCGCGVTFQTRRKRRYYHTKDCYKRWLKKQQEAAKEARRLKPKKPKRSGWSDMASFFQPRRRNAVIRPLPH